MQAARRRSAFDFTSRLGRRAEAGPRRVLPQVGRSPVSHRWAVFLLCRTTILLERGGLSTLRGARPDARGRDEALKTGVSSVQTRCEEWSQSKRFQRAAQAASSMNGGGRSVWGSLLRLRFRPYTMAMHSGHRMRNFGRSRAISGSASPMSSLARSMLSPRRAFVRKPK